MYTLGPDEKTTPVMVYTHNSLVRGEVISRQNIRISVWLRTEGAPEYLHMLKPQFIFLNSGGAKAMTFAETYLPTAQVIAFHMSPPAKDPVDYDESEKNRVMLPISVVVGTFIFNGTLRVSTQVDFGTSIINNARISWLSIYDVKISNPNLPQMGEIAVPMVVVRPSQVNFALLT
jgi:hypothetical protein